MSARHQSVWVTRPEPGSGRTARALIDAGYDVIRAPVLEVNTVSPSPVPRGPWPDWIILVSANAARGFHRAIDGPGFPVKGEAFPKVAAVGHATAAAAGALGWSVDLVPDDQHASGLLAALAGSDLEGARVWIPSGNRSGSATQELPQPLAERGAEVQVFQVYETRERPLSEQELAKLAEAEPGAVVLHSPSAAEAVYGASEHEAIQRWQREARAIAIGPVTRLRLEELGARNVAECPKPSDAAVIELLASIIGRRA